MVSFKQFFIESGYSSFALLPDKSPYGFVVWPDGTFKPVTRMYDHATVAGGREELNNLINQGGVRILQPISDGFFGEVNRKTLKPQAKKTATDIAAFYNTDIVFVEYTIDDLL